MNLRRHATTNEGRQRAKNNLVYAIAEATTTASRGRNVEDTDLGKHARRQIRRRLRFWPSTIAAIAEYLHAYGYELTVTLVPAGQQRATTTAADGQTSDQSH